MQKQLYFRGLFNEWLYKVRDINKRNYHTSGYKILTSCYLPLSTPSDLCLIQKIKRMNLTKNKSIIAEFDKTVIEQYNPTALEALVSNHVINHAAQPGAPNGKDSFHHFLTALHTGLSDIKVTILRQIAENDLVVTHKSISGTHTGHLFGIPPTNKPLSFEAIEIIRLENGKYAEHWVQSNMATTLGSLKGH